MALSVLLCGFLIVLSGVQQVRPADFEAERTANHWRNDAYRYIRQKLDGTPNVHRAKNVIMLLGDGMSMQTIAATRAFMGGEEIKLSFEDWPHFGLAKTYAVDYQVSDSANTATAYLSGVKGNFLTIGVNGHVRLNDCEGSSDTNKYVYSIAKWAQDQGKATGFVSNSRVTHASPAGVYAHTANRYWENDQEIRASHCDPAHIEDIAQQLVYNDVGRNLQVALGGGRREFRNWDVLDERGARGTRSDGRDLIEEWVQERRSRGNASYVWNKAQLNAVDLNQTDFLLGMFDASHCPYHRDIERNGLQETVPTLKEMTVAAMQLLSKRSEGYFLFVESARIDMAHHGTWARLALEEMEEFSHLADSVKQMINLNDTLLVVTSDHSHVMSYNGYSKRGKDVLGLSDSFGSDNLPYPTLSYANGMGFYNTYDPTGARYNLANTNFSDPYLEYMASFAMDSVTHGGEDVGVYAVGPWSHLFSGNYEQNNIPVVMAYAAKIGPYATERSRSPRNGQQSTFGALLTIAMAALDDALRLTGEYIKHLLTYV